MQTRTYKIKRFFILMARDESDRFQTKPRGSLNCLSSLPVVIIGDHIGYSNPYIFCTCKNLIRTLNINNYVIKNNRIQY